MKGTQEIQDCEVQRKGTAGECCSLLDIVETSEQVDVWEGRTKRKRQAQKVAKQLRNAGFSMRADNILKCCSRYMRRKYSCSHVGPVLRMDWRCKDRLCPECQHVRSVKLAQRYGPALRGYVERNGLHAHHVVLTFAHVEGLPDWKRLKGCVKKLFSPKTVALREFWDRYGNAGVMENFEMHLAEDGMYHAHFHCVLLTERPVELIETGKHAGKWQNSVNQELSDAWREITKDSFVVYTSEINLDRIFEVVKYCFKGLTDMNNSDVEHLVEWLSGKRFTHLLGPLYNNPEFKALLADADAVAEAEAEAEECCTECGCNEWRDVLYEWHPILQMYVECEERYDESQTWPLSPS